MKKLLMLAVVVAMATAGVWAYRAWQRQTIATSQIAMLEAELSYVSQLRDGLERLKSGDSQRAVTIVLSADAINRLLEGLVDSRLDIDSIGAQAVVTGLAATFRDGFPEIQLETEIRAPKLPGSLKARIGATLEPRFLAGPSAALELFVRPLEVHPTFTAAGTTLGVDADTARMLAAVLAQYAQTAPRISVPLSSAIDVSFPASTQNLTVPTQSGALNGIVDLPSFSSRIPILVRQMYFLSDGIHLVAANNDAVPELLPYRLAPPAPVAPDQIDRVVAEKRTALTAAREAIAPIVAQLKVADADVTVDVASQVLNSVLTTINELPEANRTIRYRTLSEDGQLFRAGGGGLGCGGYAELVGHNSATADIVVSALRTEFNGTGIRASAHLAMNFAAQVTGHVHGAAGPRVRMETRCIGGGWSKICADVPVTTISCESPIGGGIGLSNYGIKANRAETVTAQVTLRSDAESWLHYDVAIVAPAQVPITIEVGLGQLGNLGLPFTFNVPQSRIASGSAPSLFGTRGELNAPAMLQKPRTYDIAIQPRSASVSVRGYQVKSSIAVTWSGAV